MASVNNAFQRANESIVGTAHQRLQKKCKCFFKVLSLLEACFDLFLSPSLSMKIQILGGKIIENLGFESPRRKVNNAFKRAHESLVGAAHQRQQKKCKCFFLFVLVEDRPPLEICFLSICLATSP